MCSENNMETAGYLKLTDRRKVLKDIDTFLEEYISDCLCTIYIKTVLFLLCKYTRMLINGYSF